VILHDGWRAADIDDEALEGVGLRDVQDAARLVVAHDGERPAEALSRGGE
jgi:hypothetical protein